MPLHGIPDIAARLGIDLGPGAEPTRESLLSAINVELRDLQVPQPSPEQHKRQVALIDARGELLGTGQAGVSSTTDLVPFSVVNQMMEVFQKNMVQERVVTPSRPDPILTMRTNVKATATQASADFTKTRSLPFAGAGGLALSVYGLRTYFGVGEMELSEHLFYPFLALAVSLIMVGYFLSTWAQRQASAALRALYNPDVQEEALNLLGDESSLDSFGSHTRRMDVMRGRPGRRSHRAIDEGGGIIINRSLYQDALHDVAYNYRPWTARSYVVDLLSTVDLAAAIDDATGLALDRLCDLKIIEPVVYNRRQAFRLIDEAAAANEPSHAPKSA